MGRHWYHRNPARGQLPSRRSDKDIEMSELRDRFNLETEHRIAQEELQGEWKRVSMGYACPLCGYKIYAPDITLFVPAFCPDCDKRLLQPYTTVLPRRWGSDEKEEYDNTISKRGLKHTEEI